MLKPIILIDHHININFLKQRYIAYVFSIFITVATFCLLFYKGLNLGIDFTGGMIIEIKEKTENTISTDVIRSFMKKEGYNTTDINQDTKHNITIKFQPKTHLNQDKELQNIKTALNTQFYNIEFRKIDYVGPKVGKELVYKGILAIIASLIAMMTYVTFRFNWRCGLGVIISLIHDALATVGFYAISDFEFDVLSSNSIKASN